MTATREAQNVLDRDFLDIRHGLLSIAAALDRIDRGAGSDKARGDARMGKIDEAIQALREQGAQRAERVQQIFSRQYDPHWRG